MDFVKNRQYFLNANGNKSQMKTVNIGVPQGSTLGPLLFLLYINDMINSSNMFHLTQFADDSTATYSGPNLNNVLNVIEKEFPKVLDWLTANKLIINLSKTHLMVFTNKKRPQTVSLNVKGTLISETNETKFLGIILDNNLSWHAHIKHISSKISKSASILKYLKYIFPSVILKTLYQTLVFPYINYCNIIWGSACKTTLRPITLLQKKCIRIINKTSYLEHTEPLFKKTGLLKINQVYLLNCAKFMHKCINTNLFLAFKDKLHYNASIHRYNTRIGYQLRQPFEKLNKCINSFFISGIKLWNDLPSSTRDIKDILTFKKSVKLFLLIK